MACPPAGVGLGSAEKLCSLRGEESAALISKPQPNSPQTSRGGSETARRQGTLFLSFCPLLPSPFPLFLPSFLHVFLAGIFSSITNLIYYYFLSKRKTPHRKAGSHPETPPGCVLIPPRPTSTSLSLTSRSHFFVTPIEKRVPWKRVLSQKSPRREKENGTIIH